MEITIDEPLRRRLETLRPGEKLVYHKGFLAVDAEGNKAIQSAGETAYLMRHRVCLVQQKTPEKRPDGFSTFLYMAIGRAI